MNIDKAMLDPANMFSCPADVLYSPALSQEQKISILRRWEYDARELQVAEEENMAGGPPDILDEILAALHHLNADIDLDHSSPTKQGGE